MLTVVPLQNPRDKLRVLESFDERNATWVVADIEAKLNLQEHLLSRKSFLFGDSVIRASELWQKLLLRSRPDLHVVSPDFMRNWIADLLEPNPHPWAQTAGAATLLYDYIGQLMPILTHHEGAAQMREWFELRPESHNRWGRWYELAQTTWNECLQKGLLSTQWVSGVLVNDVDFAQIWQRPLVFDLGADLIQVEADVIVAMARHLDVTVLEPHPSWWQRFDKTLGAYQQLQPPAVKPKSMADETPCDPRITCHKFSTMLSEVKFATAQVRSWVESGVALSQIALIMPDVEVYWPALAAYLQEEGVPTQKARVTKLHALPDVSRWLAQLRLHSGAISSADLELCTFSTHGAMGFDRFRRLFTEIYGHENLQRDTHLRELYATPIDRHRRLERDEFVAWALAYWPNDQDTTALERAYRQFFQECSQNIQMTLHRWIRLLEQIAARTEVTLSESLADGVVVSNLSSADQFECTHIILCGLSESALRQVSSTAIIYGDVLSIANRLGFHLAYPDQNKLEFAARWLLENRQREFHLCFAASDFNGAALAPSLTWLQTALERHQHEDTSIAPPTRWDEIQLATLEQVATVRDWPEAQQVKLIESIEQDLGLRSLKPFVASRELTLSASSIERYLNCPFIFAAESLLRLSDVEALDLDVDSRSRGQLMHGIFEDLLKTKTQDEWSDLQLTELVDVSRASHHVEIADEELWPPLREKYVALAKRFLNFERNWQARFSDVQTAGVEVQVVGFLHPDGRLSSEVGEGAVRFRGKIDRVDLDPHGHAVILDYKTSRASDKITSAPSWLEKQSLQLPLYAMAIEAGLAADVPPSEVMGAFFYIAKGFNRDVGMRLKEFEDVLYAGNRYMKKIDLSGKAELMSEVRSHVAQVLARIQSGDFAPQPKDVKACENCQWRSLCRAPHLN
jgi:RecB family exonuclease